jgi:hypothetical protein
VSEELLFSDQHKRADDEFVAEIRTNINSKSELLVCLTKALDAPGYFGANWDSLVDILRDLSWIEHKRVTIHHNDLPNLHASELRTYLDILQTRAHEWRSRDEHLLSVIFPIAARDAVIRALGAQQK